MSLAYVAKLMHREYRDTPLFRSVLQSIGHQVNSGQEIYVVGQIKDDGTVKGGTGWGAEFAKLCNKLLYVFDQSNDAWQHWTGESWEAAGEPVITHPTFTGRVLVYSRRTDARRSTGCSSAPFARQRPAAYGVQAPCVSPWP